MKLQRKDKAGNQSTDACDREPNWDLVARRGIQDRGLYPREKARDQIRLKVQREWDQQQDRLETEWDLGLRP